MEGEKKYFVVLQRENRYFVIDSYFSDHVIDGYYKGPFPQFVSYVIGPKNLKVDTSKCEMIDGMLVVSEDDNLKNNYIENIKRQVREKKDKILTITDWTLGFDSPFNDSDKSKMVTFRQQWRDLTGAINESNYDNVPYPPIPDISDARLLQKIGFVMSF